MPLTSRPSFLTFLTMTAACAAGILVFACGSFAAATRADVTTDAANVDARAASDGAMATDAASADVATQGMVDAEDCDSALLCDPFDRTDVSAQSPWTTIHAPEAFSIDQTTSSPPNGGSLRVDSNAVSSGASGSGFLEFELPPGTAHVALLFSLHLLSNPNRHIQLVNIRFVYPDPNAGHSQVMLFANSSQTRLQLGEQDAPNSNSGPIDAADTDFELPLNTWERYRLDVDRVSHVATLLKLRTGELLTLAIKIRTDTLFSVRIGTPFVEPDSTLKLWLDDVVIR